MLQPLKTSSCSYLLLLFATKNNFCAINDFVCRNATTCSGNVRTVCVCVCVPHCTKKQQQFDATWRLRKSLRRMFDGDERTERLTRGFSASVFFFLFFFITHRISDGSARRDVRHHFPRLPVFFTLRWCFDTPLSLPPPPTLPPALRICTSRVALPAVTCHHGNGCRGMSLVTW